MKNNYQIVDQIGVIHSGSLEEMEHAFDVMTQGTYKYSLEEVEKYSANEDLNWSGDLKLIQVLKIAK